nr:hypothetical protein GW17_00009362 [Ipomoea trifida]
MEEMAAARAAVKLGSAVIAAVAALKVSDKEGVTVGNGAEAEIVATLEEHGRIALARKFGFIIISALGMEPESSIFAAAEVVDAMAMAAGGRGWLCVPSYVVVKMCREMHLQSSVIVGDLILIGSSFEVSFFTTKPLSTGFFFSEKKSTSFRTPCCRLSPSSFFTGNMLAVSNLGRLEPKPFLKMEFSRVSPHPFSMWQMGPVVGKESRLSLTYGVEEMDRPDRCGEFHVMKTKCRAICEKPSQRI